MRSEVTQPGRDHAATTSSRCACQHFLRYLVREREGDARVAQPSDDEPGAQPRRRENEQRGDTTSRTCARRLRAPSPSMCSSVQSRRATAEVAKNSDTGRLSYTSQARWGCCTAAARAPRGRPARSRRRGCRAAGRGSSMRALVGTCAASERFVRRQMHATHGGRPERAVRAVITFATEGRGGVHRWTVTQNLSARALHLVNTRSRGKASVAYVGEQELSVARRVRSGKLARRQRDAAHRS